MGSAHTISILLDRISSIEVRYRSKIIYLILTVAALVAGAIFLTENEEEIAIILGSLAILFLVLYFFSRKHLLTISSNGGAKINFHFKRAKTEKVKSFINKVEKACLART